jgi:bifunctional non-homologous end joining protein LigD
VTAFRFIQPCSPIRAKEVPAGDAWLHEVKFDGYRVQAHKVGSQVVIYSRNGHDFTERFLPSTAAARAPSQSGSARRRGCSQR